MHCYAPNFEEVEGANWFGPVRPFIPPPPPPNFFFRFAFFVKTFTYSSPRLPPALPSHLKKKILFILNFDSL